MTDKEKINLADFIINTIKERSLDSDMPVFIGTLNKAQGIKGFKTAEIGHPVFDTKDRYTIYLERDDALLTVSVSYYKKTLSSSINFSK